MAAVGRDWSECFLLDDLVDDGISDADLDTQLPVIMINKTLRSMNIMTMIMMVMMAMIPSIMAMDGHDSHGDYDDHDDHDDDDDDDNQPTLVLFLLLCALGKQVSLRTRHKADHHHDHYKESDDDDNDDDDHHHDDFDHNHSCAPDNRPPGPNCPWPGFPP